MAKIPEAQYETERNIINAKKRPPMNEVYVLSKRILVRYAEEGGIEKEGIIEIRPGVSDISIGDRFYAQVRIPVDTRWYIKGIATYSNDIPNAYDIVYYTRKPKGTPLKRSVFGKWGTVFKFVNKHTAFTHPRQSFIIETEGKWKEWSKPISFMGVPTELCQHDPVCIDMQSKEYKSREGQKDLGTFPKMLLIRMTNGLRVPYKLAEVGGSMPYHMVPSYNGKENKDEI